MRFNKKSKHFFKNGGEGTAGTLSLLLLFCISDSPHQRIPAYVYFRKLHLLPNTNNDCLHCSTLKFPFSLQRCFFMVWLISFFGLSLKRFYCRVSYKKISLLNSSLRTFVRRILLVNYYSTNSSQVFLLGNWLLKIPIQELILKEFLLSRKFLLTNPFY